MTTIPLRQRSAWQALEAHKASLDATNLRALFADDATRGERLRVDAEGIHLDYSKQRVTDETLRLLLESLLDLLENLFSLHLVWLHDTCRCQIGKAQKVISNRQ